jgi:predicted component of type VI protein secretion system
MCHDVAFSIVIGDVIAQRSAVFIRDINAVLVQQRHDFVVKAYEALVQDVLNLGLADFVLTKVIKVDFVDRAAGCYEANKHVGNAIIRL